MVREVGISGDGSKTCLGMFTAPRDCAVPFVMWRYDGRIYPEAWDYSAWQLNSPLSQEMASCSACVPPEVTSLKSSYQTQDCKRNEWCLTPPPKTEM